MNAQTSPLGLYLHWPFCLSKCPYCDFNTHVQDDIDHDRWLAAYVRALRYYAALTDGRELTSVFFGGGTPSLMPPDMLAGIIGEIKALWTCAPDLEITMEANPTSVVRDKFAGFAHAGVNRVSLGVQSLNDSDLAFLGREHSAAEAIDAIAVARDVFPRFSFDLIYARPNQDLSAWRDELHRALALDPRHLSVYQLTIERNTPFYYDHAQGVFNIPDQDLAADFYTLTQDVLGAAGLPSYELSNHAVAGDECRHNLIYWHYHDYIGIGPGAHGRLTIEGRKSATRDHAAPEIWLQRVEAQGHGAHPWQALSAQDQAFERLMMGLRLREGIALCADDWRYLLRDKVDVIAAQGWCVYRDDHICLTQEGLLRLNSILPFVFARPTG